jgi:dCMP deaminase
MKTKFKLAFMECAETFAKLSYAKRAQVGAIIVKENRIISIGYNGMPAGWDNQCEYYDPNTIESWMSESDHEHYGKLISKPEVLHAETNALAKVAQSSESSAGAAMFCTHMPCMDCAKLIYQSGIVQVYYRNKYKAARGSGSEFLEKSGVALEQI